MDQGMIWSFIALAGVEAAAHLHSLVHLLLWQVTVLSVWLPSSCLFSSDTIEWKVYCLVKRHQPTGEEAYFCGLGMHGCVYAFGFGTRLCTPGLSVPEGMKCRVLYGWTLVGFLPLISTQTPLWCTVTHSCIDFQAPGLFLDSLPQSVFVCMVQPLEK